MSRNKQRSLLKIALAERPLNPDQQVNRGCNLKWKLAHEENNPFATIVFFKTQIGSEPKMFSGLGYNSRD